MPLRILLADDHVLVREGVRAVLEANGHHVVGEASDGREAVRLALELRPDIAVFDIGMPELNGVDAARAVLRDEPKLRIILLTVHIEDQYVIEALRAGVSGYVLKKMASADLVRAIEEVQRGDIHLSPGISRTLVEAFRQGSDLAADPLTTREREVLQLVAEGKTMKQAASILGISVKTVETHRSHLVDKLQIRDTAGLVRYALRRGLVTL